MLLSGGILLCVSRKVVPWSTHFDVKILVPRSYLRLLNYVYRPTVPSCPSRCVRRHPPSVRRVVRPVVRPVVAVRPLSVRPIVSCRRRRRPLSVRPSRRRPRSSVRPPGPSIPPVRRPYQLTQSNGCIFFENVIRLQKTAIYLNRWH